MAKSDVTAETPVEVVAESLESFDLTIDEFCLRLSKEVSAPELIGGFHHDEKAAGRVKDSEPAYRARYAAFGNKPA